MEANRSPKVKICCIQSIAEANRAIHAGADLIGLVSAMPSGPGVITEGRIAQIAEAVRGLIQTVLLTSKQEADAIIAQARRTHTDVLQLVDLVAESHLKRLRRELPEVKVIQVVHITDQNALGRARRAAPMVDALLLDSGNPFGAVKELGGTGRLHDWALSKRIREELEIPVFLAGGLTKDNVRRAVIEVGPAGVDVCSGVRTAGALDQDKLQDFITNARAR